MFRTAALLLLLVAVAVAQAPGSVVVTKRLVTWTFDGTDYAITSNQARVNGEGPFFDPRRIRFRIPSKNKSFRLPAVFKLTKSVRRVKSFTVNGNTFTVRYNKKGKAVKRIVCTKGNCDFRRTLVEDESEELEETPSDRSLQKVLGWSCDACDDFWATMCNARGISLLCNTRGTAAVQAIGDSFARRAVNSLCGPLLETCDVFDDRDADEICFSDFDADECPVFESLRF